MELELKFV